MISDDDYDPEGLQPEEDALARRLRRIQWPGVRSDLRERCWQEISRRIAELEPEPGDPLPATDPPINTTDSESYDFSRLDLAASARMGGRRLT